MLLETLVGRKEHNGKARVAVVLPLPSEIACKRFLCIEKDLLLVGGMY